MNEAAAVNPLLSRQLVDSPTMSAWRARLKKAKSRVELLGLLHSGFEIAENRDARMELVPVYCDFADHWNNAERLERPDDPGYKFVIETNSRGVEIYGTMKNMRQFVAEKAFMILCTEVFGPKVREAPFRDLATWGKEILDSPILPAIQKLFRPELYWQGTEFEQVYVHNLPKRKDEDKPHGEQLAVAFLLKFADFLWAWTPATANSLTSAERRRELEEENARHLPLVLSSRLWMLDILTQLGKLNRLSRAYLTFDTESLAKLREIALRTYTEDYADLEEKRRVTSVEEALYVGSKAAALLLQIEVLQREHARQQALRAAHEEATAAQERLAQLGQK